MLKNLMARRVPHILGIYLAAGWAALEFVDWVVSRYALSPHVTDLALMTWALMVPSVLLLAYGHGAPGRDEWSRMEKVGVPVNLVLAMLVLFVSFWGKDLGATTTEITVEDESGQAVARTVPKSEFRKHLALFYFDNETGDTTLDWLQYGIPLGIQDDLLQDMFLDVRTSWQYFAEQLEEAGYAEGVDVPLALKREITEELHLDRFASGRLTGTRDSLTVVTELHDVGRGRLLEERRFTGSDVFDLIDRVSAQLKRDLGLPEQHIEDEPDLQFAEMATTSRAAYRDFIAGYRALESEEWQEAVAAFTAATKEDPTYSFANLMLFIAQLFRNDVGAATQALEAAMEHAYKLPERYQFMMRGAYYRVVRQEYDKARAVAEMHAELFPSDLAAHNLLLILHQQAGEWEKAIGDAKRILELDPRQYDAYRAIGALNQHLGRFDSATAYYERFAEEFPQDPRSFADLGDVARARGAHDAARGHYERALLLDEDNLQVLLASAELESELGQVEAARARIAEALDAAATPHQRWQALDASRRLHERSGAMQEAVRELESAWDALDQAQPPVWAVQLKLRELDTFVKAGQVERARSFLDDAARQMQPPFDRVVSLGRLVVALELEDTSAIESALTGVDSLIETMEIGALRPTLLHGRGRLLELRGDCAGAIGLYRRVTELEPAAQSVHLHIGRCQRKLGEHDAALASLRQYLQVDPFAPRGNHEMAKVYLAMGDTARAREHLERALTVWQGADADYAPAREAREQLARFSH